MKVPMVEVMAPNQSRRKSRYRRALKVREKRVPAAASRVMGMTDRDRQRIRGIRRHRRVAATLHQQSHHLRHLLLLRGAVAYNGILHAAWCVLENLQPRGLDGEQDDAPRVRELDEALDVAARERRLDGDGRGRRPPDD